METVREDKRIGIAPPPELMAPPLRAGRAEEAKGGLPPRPAVSVADAPAVYSHVPPTRPRKRKLKVTQLHLAVAAASGLALALGCCSLLLAIWLAVGTFPDPVGLSDIDSSLVGQRVTLGTLDVTHVDNTNPYGSAAPLLELVDSANHRIMMLNTRGVDLIQGQECYGLNALVMKLGNDLVLSDPIQRPDWIAEQALVPPIAVGSFLLMLGCGLYYYLHRIGLGFFRRRI